MKVSAKAIAAPDFRPARLRPSIARLRPSIARLLAIAAGLFASAAIAAYPDRPITLIVPWPAGGSTDISMRAIADSASKFIGQPITIDNKAGGGGTHLTRSGQ